MRILSFFILGFLSLNLNAQCTIGALDQAIWGSPSDFDLGLTLNATIGDIDTAYIYQGADTAFNIQFLLPKKQAITSPVSGTATINSVQILGVSGMPLGLSYVSDAAATNDTYYPQTFRYGVVTICGETFSSPGLKTVTVQVLGCGSLSGISQCQTLSLEFYVEVLPGTGGGPISLSPASSCDSADVALTTTLSSPNPVLNPVAYEWLFSDGTTASGVNVNKSYNTPGEYPVKLSVIISEYYIESASTVFSSGWYPDIEEVSALQNPEPYLQINGGNGATSTGTNGSGKNKTWSGLNIPLTSDTISITGWDEDTNTPIFGSADDNLGTISFPVINPSVGLSVGGSNGNFSANVVLNIQVAETLVFWDTIRVTATPIPDPIVASNGFDICAGDSTTLNVGAGYDLIKWFDANGEIFGQTDSTLNVTVPGTYYAELIQTGSFCPAYTDTATVSFTQVSQPEIEIASTGGFYIDNPNNFDVQWYANGSGFAIPIPNATNDTLGAFNPNNAPFTVEITSANGCSSVSNPFSVCLAGTSSAASTEVSLGNPVLIESNDFVLKPGNEVAWAVTSENDGPVMDAVDLQDAIAANMVFPGNANNYTVDCASLPSGIANGNYYFTPIAAEALVIDSVFWNPAADSGCVPNAEFCLDITGTDWLILSSSLTFTFPDGSSVNIIDELIPPNFPIALPDTLTPSLLSLIPSVLPGGLCFQLNDLYAGNPNGNWSVSAQNVGTGTLNVEIFDFTATVSTDSCSLITSDQVTNIPGQSGSIAGGASGSITFTVPPVSANFPTIAADCDVIGEATLISIDCGTAISDVVDVNSFNLYPNPNNGSFKVALDVKERTGLNLQIVDVTGRTILAKRYPSVNGHFNETFNLSNNLNSGFYVINIEIDGNTIQKHFIVK